jgi:hypothetical protein
MGIVKEKIKDLKTRESRILGMGGKSWSPSTRKKAS